MARVTKFTLALVLAVIAVLVALVLILALALPFVDWNQHKPLLVGVVERFSDWEVKQIGDIEVDLYFPTRIRVDDVELTQQAPDSALSSVSASSFEVSLNPLSLVLYDRPVIHHLGAADARLIAKTPEQPPEDTGPPTIPRIDSARIRNVDLVFQGDSGEDRRLHLAALDVSAREEDAGLSLSGKGQVEGLPMSLSGTLGDPGNLSDNIPLPFNIQGVFARDEFALQGEVTSLEETSGRADVSVRGDNLDGIAEAFGVSLGDVPSYVVNFSFSGSAEQVNLKRIDLRLGESSLKGKANLALSGARPRLQATLSSSLVRQQDLAGLMPEDGAEPNGTGAPSPSPGEPLPLDILDALNAEVSYQLAEFRGHLPVPVSGTRLDASLEDGLLHAALRTSIESQTVTLEAEAGPHRSESGSTTLPFALVASMGSDRLTTKGRITAGREDLDYSARVNAEGEELAEIARLLGVVLTDVPPYQLAFDVSGSTDRVRIEEVHASLGESSLTGDASLALTGSRASLKADLFSPLLRQQDLASLVPESPEPGATDVTTEPSPEPGAPPSLDFLEGLNARVSYRVGEYRSDPPAPVDSGRFDLNIADGRLEIAGRADGEDRQISLDGAVGPRQGDAENPALPFRLAVTAAGDRLSTDGRMNVENGSLHLTTQTSAEGRNLAALPALFGINLTAVPAYRLDFSVSASPQQVRVEDLQATLGSSYLYGDISLKLDREKPYLRADLGSSLLREQDLTSLIPAESPQPTDDSPGAALPLDFLDAVNAELSFAVAELEGELFEPVAGGNLQARLHDGELDAAARVLARDMEFDLDGNAGPVQQSEPGITTFPFALELAVAGDSLVSEGQVTLKQQTLALGVDLSASGNNLGGIAGLLEVSLPDAPSYQLRFSARVSDSEVAIEGLQLMLGSSRLYADAALQLNGPRPHLTADVELPILRHKDLMGLIPENGGEPTNTNVFSREPLNLEPLSQMDADVRLAIDAYEGSTGAPLLSGMIAQSRLANGSLAVQPFHISLAGGTVNGHLQLESRDDPPTLKGYLSAESVNLNDLIVPFFDLEERGMEARGGMDANVEVTSSGKSLHQWASRADGRVNWAIYDGVLPGIVVEGLGLDVTEAAVSWFGDTVATGINCGVGMFRITEGVIRTRILLLSTVDSNILGNGTINLSEETVNYALQSTAKDFSFLASDSPIRIEGPLNRISVDVVSEEFLSNLGISAVLALLNPLLAVIPFVDWGTGETDHCQELQRTIRQVEAESD